MRKENWKIILGALLIISTIGCSEKTIKTEDNYEIIDLADGSWIYLNKHSQVSFDPDFKDRTISLKGQSFINVKEGLDQNFMIKTPQATIEVTGTELLVKADQEETNVEVKNGSVKVIKDDIVKSLKKGEKAIAKAGRDAIKTMEAEFQPEKWMRQLEIEFKRLDKDIKNITRDLEKDLKNVEKDFKKGLKELTQ